MWPVSSLSGLRVTSNSWCLRPLSFSGPQSPLPSSCRSATSSCLAPVSRSTSKIRSRDPSTPVFAGEELVLVRERLRRARHLDVAPLQVDVVVAQEQVRVLVPVDAHARHGVGGAGTNRDLARR